MSGHAARNLMQIRTRCLFNNSRRTSSVKLLQASHPNATCMLIHPPIQPYNRKIHTTSICHSSSEKPLSKPIPARASLMQPDPNDNPESREHGPPLQLYNVMADMVPPGWKVGSVKQDGFIVGDFDLPGPVILLNGSLFMWDVPQFGCASDEILDAESDGVESVDEEGSPFHGWDIGCLRLLEVVDPRPEILVLGTGAKNYPLPSLLRAYLLKLGMQIEVTSTRNAASTYNVLLQEGRRAGALLLPLFPTSARTGQSLITLGDPSEIESNGVGKGKEDSQKLQST
ncbi:hypothetical protein SmJEL517_g02960 [Synchytrium microbalum]|uniref:NADH dehydrogenase [ubiquinone] 1 alpha subcomplex assembly factor 3 n=1 Tax=Synchytrium microbalum TaxID=1806994 RepID=A0A507C5E8_9FUNG|nr:uncharacterized protein SmJEL517_g02960 [Synchytrium microbalum]TPX34349.1 hypothetical protein SmJEL517_g02960 [Synchytrium microbalum]